MCTGWDMGLSHTLTHTPFSPAWKRVLPHLPNESCTRAMATVATISQPQVEAVFHADGSQSRAGSSRVNNDSYHNKDTRAVFSLCQEPCQALQHSVDSSQGIIVTISILFYRTKKPKVQRGSLPFYPSPFPGKWRSPV